MTRILWLGSLLFCLVWGHAVAEGLVLTTEDAPPYNYTTDGGQTVVGSATETLRELFSRTAIPYSISLYPWVRAFEMAKSEKDTCVYSTTRTEERENSFSWVGPIAPDNWMLFAKTDSAITLHALEDAKKYKVGGYRGDSVTLYLQQQKFLIDEATNDEQNARKLDSGRIDLWATGILTGPFVANKLKTKIKPVLTIKRAELYLACNLGVAPTIIHKLNATLKSMVKDGTLDKIKKKYQ